jgi:hypothetical protein
MHIHTAFLGISVSLIYSQVSRQRYQGSIDKRKSKETKQRASYSRWPLAASALIKTYHSLIKPETNEDKIIAT